MHHALRRRTAGARLSQPHLDVGSLTRRSPASQRIREHLKHFVALGDINHPRDARAMSEPIALTLGQQFELERMSRAIDATADLQALQGLAKQLLQAWHSQKAATEWVMRQQLDGAPRFGAELSSLRADLAQGGEAGR